MNREIKDLLRDARERGWAVGLTKRGFWVAPPDDTNDRVFFHGTPSDHRAIKNTLAELRRRGWDGNRRGKKVDIPDHLAPIFTSLQDQLVETEEIAEGWRVEFEAAKGRLLEMEADLCTAEETRRGALLKFEAAKSKSKERQDTIERLLQEIEGQKAAPQPVAVETRESSMDIGEAITKAGELLKLLEDYDGGDDGRVNPTDLATVVRFMEHITAPDEEE